MQHHMPTVDLPQIGAGTSMYTGGHTMNLADYLDFNVISVVFGGSGHDAEAGFSPNSILEGIFSHYQPTLDFL